MISECLSPDVTACLALGVPLEEQDPAVRMQYFSNTALMQRHLCIAERLLILLYRATQFYTSPEPLPVVFYNQLLPNRVGRSSADITNCLVRFLNMSLEHPTDARGHIFGLLYRLLSNSAEKVDQNWLQPCTESVALQIWLDPTHVTNKTTLDPYDIRAGAAVTAIQWFDACPGLLQRFQAKYTLRLTNSCHKPVDAHLFFPLDGKFCDQLLADGAVFEIPKKSKQRRILKRWLTLWTFHCLGGMTEEWIYDVNHKSPHDLVRHAHLICVSK
jgi:hypothetical protein